MIWWLCAGSRTFSQCRTFGGFPQDRYRSGFFCINRVFYVDRRPMDAVDYSEVSSAGVSLCCGQMSCSSPSCPQNLVLLMWKNCVVSCFCSPPKPCLFWEHKQLTIFVLYTLALSRAIHSQNVASVFSVD